MGKMGKNWEKWNFKIDEIDCLWTGLRSVFYPMLNGLYFVLLWPIRRLMYSWRAFPITNSECNQGVAQPSGGRRDSPRRDGSSRW